MKIAPALWLLLFSLQLSLHAQTSTPSPDPWKPLAFLEGTWEAKAKGQEGVTAKGIYTFRLELANHILARHSVSYSDEKKSATFDYQHGDLLYVYEDGPGPSLKAIYFDSEGHVIHYDVSTPDSSTAVFLSDGPGPGPQFRLIYHLQGAVMSGKFQMHMPGQADWNSYLKWSGTKE